LCVLALRFQHDAEGLRGGVDVPGGERGLGGSPATSPIRRAINALTRDSGRAPMKPSTGLPSWKANTAGIDCTPI
jgi:hypothetical protein